MNILLLLLAMVQDQTSVAIETKDNFGDGKGARIVSSYNIYLGLNSTFDTFLSSHIFNSKIFVSPSQQLQKNGKMWDLFPKSATKWWWWLWWWWWVGGGGEQPLGEKLPDVFEAKSSTSGSFSSRSRAQWRQWQSRSIASYRKTMTSCRWERMI